MMKIGTRVFCTDSINNEYVDYEEFTIVSKRVDSEGVCWYGCRADDGVVFWIQKNGLRKVVEA